MYVPIGVTLKYLEILLVIKDIDKNKIQEYVQLSFLCMPQSSIEDGSLACG